MITKKEYIEALERMKESYYNLDGCMSAMNKFKEDINLLTGLVNEHFEEKVETNFDHYFEYLSKLNMSDFALIDGRVGQCSDTCCSECGFNGDCVEGKFRWLKQPYKKPVYKLTKFEIDLLQSCSQGYSQKYQFKNINSLTEMRKNGYFKCINRDETIEEILAKCEVMD